MTHEQYLSELIYGFRFRGRSDLYSDPAVSGSSEADAVARWLASHVSDYVLCDPRSLSVDYCRAWRRWARDGCENVDFRITVDSEPFQFKVCVLRWDPGYKYELFDWSARHYDSTFGMLTDPQSPRPQIRDSSRMYSRSLTRLRWVEIDPNRSAPPSLAGPTDLPDRDWGGREVAPQFGRPGLQGETSTADAAAATVQFLGSAANDLSLNDRIEQELRGLSAQAISRFPEITDDGGGVLAVADIEVLRDQGMEAQRFQGCSIFGVYPSHRAAVAEYSQTRFYRRPGMAIRHRYFWTDRKTRKRRRNPGAPSAATNGRP